MSFHGLIDLAAEEIGGSALLTSDDFFAGMENLLKPGRGVFIADKFTDRGKWMDGWESRRKRVPGHDWCIIRLGARGKVRGLDLDTNHFLGNHAPFASVDALCTDDVATELLPEQEWTRILDQSALKAGSQNLFPIAGSGPWTHLRLNIYPDGGVARFRVFGEPAPTETEGVIDLASVAVGAKALVCSDMFFSSMDNLLLPGRSQNMAGGWETRRRRGPGHDWVIIRLGQPGALERVVVDTNHFKGNFPDRWSIEGVYWPGAPPARLTALEDGVDGWQEVIAYTRLRAHSLHTFDSLSSAGPFSHIRMRVAPCGGVSRLRVFGRPAHPDGTDALLETVNEGGDEPLSRCCGSTRWVSGLRARRPFLSRAALFGTAEEVWWHLSDRDWQEAFSHHPRIGADPEKLRARFARTAEWAQGEQQGVMEASDETLQALGEANRSYEARFGYVFIVCATGKTAAEMLGLLEERLQNLPENEIRIAAGEQAKITRIRLEKL